MSTLKVNAITDTTGLLAPVFPAGSAQLNPLANREDRIINGDMNLWQRALTSTGNGYVAADRWSNNVGGGTVTQSRQAFTVGDTLGVTSPAFFLRQSVSGQTLSTNYASVLQSIEGVRSYAGQTITILGWARRSSGTGNMVVEMEQYFGGGGSPSPTIAAISPTTVNLGVTGTWAPFAAVMTVPSITGKTLGTDGNDRIAVFFWTSAGSTFNARTNSLGLQTIGVDLWGIHIREGTWTAAATADYRPRDPMTELALCYRYFQRFDLTLTMGTAGATGLVATKYATADSLIASLPLISPMRRAPIMAASSTTARFVTSAGGTPPVSLVSYSAPANGPISMLYSNGGVGPSFGWIDTVGIVSADAEL